MKPRILRLVPLPPKGETSPIENIVVKPIDLDDLRHHLATTKDQFDALDNDTWVANVKPEEWSQIIERATEGLKLQVANSSAAPISVLDKLAKDPELWVKQALSKNPSGSESAIEKVGTNSYSYLPAVADKINTPKTQPAKSDGLLVEPPLINKNRSNLRQDHLTYVAGFILFLLVQGFFFFSAVISGEKDLIGFTITSIMYFGFLIMFFGFLFSVFLFWFCKDACKKCGAIFVSNSKTPVNTRAVIRTRYNDQKTVHYDSKRNKTGESVTKVPEDYMATESEYRLDFKCRKCGDSWTKYTGWQ